MRRPLIGILPLVDIQRESYWMLPGYMRGGYSVPPRTALMSCVPRQMPRTALFRSKTRGNRIFSMLSRASQTSWHRSDGVCP